MAKQQIAANVRRLRNARGWSQKELGRRIGMSLSAIGQIERAEVDTAASTIQAMAEEFGVPIGEISGERSAGDGFSKDASKIAEWYDSLDLDDRAYVMKFFQKTFGFDPSPR